MAEAATPSSSSSSNGNYAHLPEHLWSEILLLLPVKSILRLKLVCKSWLSLIKSSDFVYRHHRHPRRMNYDDPIVICVQSVRTPGQPIEFLLHSLGQDDLPLDIELNIPSRSYNLNMLCLDGIICLSCNVETDTNDSVMDIYLWNPATKKRRALPQRPVPLLLSDDDDCLVWEDLTVGFGFDVKTNDYKLVRITTNKMKTITTWREKVVGFRVEVYNLSSDSWRTIDVVLPVDMITYGLKQPYKNGGIYYWSARKSRSESSVDEFYRLILWFDFSNEVFGTMPFPDSITSDSGTMPFPDSIESDPKLTIVRDNIAFIDYLRTGVFDVWMMNEYGVKESWTKLYTIGPFWEDMVSYWKHVVLILNNGDSVLVLGNYHLCIYQIVNQGILNFPLRKDFPNKVVLEVVGYKESLVSIESKNGASNSLTSWSC